MPEKSSSPEMPLEANGDHFRWFCRSNRFDVADFFSSITPFFNYLFVGVSRMCREAQIWFWDALVFPQANRLFFRRKVL